tara:strand:+ start:3027 stop:4280 length:1254 start_codon:yes stop_codon:yes gene_type:complete
MLFAYRFLINLITILSPIIILYRLLKKKESLTRFREKFCFFSKKKVGGKLIWFHGASVGELQSIVPLLEKLEKNNEIKQILITSNTLSSAKVIEKIKIKKIVHQFFPVDTNQFSKKFLDYWKPTAAFFIDSEIWPNMLVNLKKKNISIVLINGRITKKTFSRWNLALGFSRKIFGKFDLCMSSSKESKNFLTRLGAKNIKFFGNLKYSQSEKRNFKINNFLKKNIKKRKIWCASSTHETEENFCGKVHLQLKKKYLNLLTIIIPRHIERVNLIKSNLQKLGLKVQTFRSNENIKKDTDVYLIDEYGKTKSFYNLSNNVFLGGSLINHGGQNPLEAARYGCNILHGPNVSNFHEIYRFLKRMKISKKITNQNQTVNLLVKFLSKKIKTKKTKQKLNKIGHKILKSTFKEIDILLKNEI